jgi:hypothetical protein
MNSLDYSTTSKFWQPWNMLMTRELLLENSCPSITKYFYRQSGQKDHKSSFNKRLNSSSLENTEERKI